MIISSLAVLYSFWIMHEVWDQPNWKNNHFVSKLHERNNILLDVCFLFLVTLDNCKLISVIIDSKRGFPSVLKRKLSPNCMHGLKMDKEMLKTSIQITPFGWSENACWIIWLELLCFFETFARKNAIQRHYAVLS